MLPALTVIISVYCCVRLFGLSFTMPRERASPRLVFLGLAIVASMIIAAECWTVLKAGNAQSEAMQNMGGFS